MRLWIIPVNFTLILGFWNNTLGAEAYDIQAYAGYHTTKFEKLQLIGQVIDKGHRISHEPVKNMGLDVRDTIITARLFRSENLRVGDEIFIIQKSSEHSRYKHGLIVSKAEVLSIFKTEFSGMMLTARGQFAMARKNFFVGRHLPSQRQSALAILKQADKMRHTGNISAALSLYKQSAQADSSRPETNLALAQLYMKQGNTTQAKTYLNTAWKHKSKFEDAQDILTLGGLYFSSALDSLHAKNESPIGKLKSAIMLLKEHRSYLKALASYKQYFTADSFREGRFHGIPDFEYQLQIGRLYETVSALLRNTNPDKVSGAFTKEEKKILFTPVFSDIKNEIPLLPRKIWDNAYLQASIFHYEIAHKINRLDNRAAYAVLELADKALAENPTANRREYFTGLIQFYSSEFLSVPSHERLMARVRSIVKTASHLR